MNTPSHYDLVLQQKCRGGAVRLSTLSHALHAASIVADELLLEIACKRDPLGLLVKEWRTSTLADAALWLTSTFPCVNTAHNITSGLT